MSILVEIGPVLSPLWKGHDHSLKQTWFLFTQRCLRPSLVEVGKFYQCNLCNFDISSPWKRVWLIFLTNLNPLHPMMLFAMFVELAQWFWGRRFLKFCQCIFAISILSSLWDCRTLTGKIGNIHTRLTCCRRHRNIGLKCFNPLVFTQWIEKILQDKLSQ